MSPEEIAYDLTTGCPECSHDIDTDDLCEHDNHETGPLCPTCCGRLHRARQPWEVAAA